MTKASHIVEQAAEAGRAQPARPEWANARRIVVKIGSSLLVDRASGQLKAAWLEALAEDVANLVKAGRETIVVSSGAIALGRHLLSFGKGALALEQSQAAAAVGQISLASAYQAAFKAQGLTAAQILLTLGDTEERRRYLNARQTISTLACPAGRAGRQRERHRCHHRDSLRG
jgi:glutamate 5-kinase